MCAYVPSYSYPFPVYQPAMRVIAAMTNSNPVTVTTTINHQYKNGLIVRLDIPSGFGMQLANQVIGVVTVTGDTTFTIPLDTTNFDPFILPTQSPNQDAQVVPVGEANQNLNSATINVLPYPAT